MIDPGVLKELLKKTEPTTLQKVERLLATAPPVAIQYVLYLKARQELAEMKGELAKLQDCVQAMESQLEHLGPTMPNGWPRTRRFGCWPPASGGRRVSRSLRRSTGLRRTSSRKIGTTRDWLASTRH